MMLKLVSRNMFSNWLGYMVQFATMFVLTPFILSSLGTTRYGVWAFCAGFTGYYGLLDAGLRGGITQYLARHLGRGEAEEVNRVLSCGVVALGVVGLVTLLASGGLAGTVPWFLASVPEYHAEATWCVIIFGASAAWQAVMAPYASIFAAAQRYDLSNVIGITSRLASAVLTYVVLQAGYGLVALSLVVAGGNILDYAARWLIAHWIVPHLHFSFASVQRDRLREVVRFGGWNFLISFAQVVFEYADPLVIVSMLTVNLVTPYALASRITTNVGSMFNSLRMVFYPTATQLHARGEWSGLRTLYFSGTRALVSLGCVAFVLGWVWCADFYRLWLQQESLTPNMQAATLVVFRLLLVTLLAQQVSAISLQMLLAYGQVRLLGIVLSVEALANLLLSFLAARIWGLTGVAGATLLTTLISRIVVIPYFTHRIMHLRPGDFWIHAILRPVMLGVVLLLAGYGWHSLSPASTWLHIAIVGAGMVSLSAVLATVIVLQGAERQRFIDAGLSYFQRATRPAGQTPTP